jgi:preprotein translocase subunit YajC
MDFFISNAWAQGAPAAGQTGGLLSFVPLILIFVVFYFLLMRPQIKRAKEHKKMVEALSKNDEVVTSGGILGRIVKVDDSFMTLEIADGVRIKVQRSAVNSLLPKGTLKEKDEQAAKSE